MSTQSSDPQDEKYSRHLKKLALELEDTRARLRELRLPPNGGHPRRRLVPAGSRRSRREHLVEVPLVAGARAPPVQLVGVGLAELGAPRPVRLVAHRDTACQHQPLDLTEAEREPEVQSHGVVDDLHRVAVTLIRWRCGAHPTDPPRSPALTNVTVPSRQTIDSFFMRLMPYSWRSNNSAFS